MQIDFSHHAYCLEGDIVHIKKILLEQLQKLKFKIKGNPDFWLGEFDTFGVDDSRRVSDFQNKKAIAGEKKIVLIETNSMTREAQNSLLKTFEEPMPHTHFFLLIPSAERLLPTLKSRMVIQVIESEEEDSLGEKFLKSSKKERLDLAKEMAEAKDKKGALKLLNQLEKLIYYKEGRPQLGHSMSKLGAKANILQTIIKFRGYLNDRSPNLKIILEHIALIIPEYK